MRAYRPCGRAACGRIAHAGVRHAGVSPIHAGVSSIPARCAPCPMLMLLALALVVHRRLRALNSCNFLHNGRIAAQGRASAPGPVLRRRDRCRARHRACSRRAVHRALSLSGAQFAAAMPLGTHDDDGGCCPPARRRTHGRGGAGLDDPRAAAGRRVVAVLRAPVGSSAT